jgi:hypothetical protein
MKGIGCAWVALASSIALAEEDIRDIRGPKELSQGSSWLTAIVGATVIGAALCAWFIWRRRRDRCHVTRLTPAQEALRRLEEARPLMRPDSAREFGIATSEVIRSYLEKRFAVVATRTTTEEFLHALLQESNDALSRHRPLLAQFLERCDFVKFAGETLAVADLESLFQSARGFVLETGEPPVA